MAGAKVACKQYRLGMHIVKTFLYNPKTNYFVKSFSHIFKRDILPIVNVNSAKLNHNNNKL